MAILIIKDDNGKTFKTFNTGEVLWQILEKKHIAEDMEEEDWLNFVDNVSSDFADEVSRLGREFVENDR